MNDYLTLSRAALSLVTAFSAATGGLLAARTLIPGVVTAAGGVFLLACGASALNQFQERDIDALMDRTKRRPLPAGRVAPRRALLFSALLIACGLGLLSGAGLGPFLLGLFAIAWYNGVYTPLKRITAFAAVPGAVTGVVPPAIGWSACGHGLWDPALGVLCALFFLWQVPHFWLLLQGSGEDYERAGLPALTIVFPREVLSRIILVWTAAAAALPLAFALFGAVRSPVAVAAQFLAGLWLAGSAVRHIGSPAPLTIFPRTNAFLLLSMAFMMLDAGLTR